MTLPTLPAPKTAVSGLLEGLGMGAQQVMPAIQEMIMERKKQQQREKFLESLFPRKSNQPDLGMEPKPPGAPGLDMQPQQDFGEMGEITPDMPIRAELGDEHQIARLLADERKLQQKEKARQEEMERADRKETKEYVQSINDGFEQAEMTDAYVNRLEQIEKENPSGPTAASIVEFFGLPIGFLNESAEEVQKISAQMATNVAKVYGFGNIRAIEFSNFLQSLPSLMNTPEGRKRIYATMRYKTSLDKARYEIKNEIEKKYKGRIPTDIQSKITERMKPYFKKFGEVLKYGYEGVHAVSKEGKKGYLHQEDVEEAKKLGYRILED